MCSSKKLRSLPRMKMNLKKKEPKKMEFELKKITNLMRTITSKQEL